MQSIVDGVVSLDEKFLVEDVADYTDDHLECIKQQDWEINDAFRNLQTTRDILTIWSVIAYVLCTWWRRLTRFYTSPIISMEATEFSILGATISMELR